MENTPKARGIVDVVFLVDCTGSMQPCIDSLKDNICRFVDYLTTGAETNQAPVRDWRGRVVGYRDVAADGDDWYVDNPFVRDGQALKEQLRALSARGGGDEPESLLDALHRLANAGETGKGEPEQADRWRYRSAAARVVVVFTDASYHATLEIPEARGGTVADVKQHCAMSRIVLSLFAPEMPCHDELAALDKSEYTPIAFERDKPGSAQHALAEFTGDTRAFDATLRQLAASVSRSAQTETL